MTHPYTLARLRQQSAIEQFHADHDRTARRSVARLDHADVSPSVVAKPETRGKAALRESGPLADGFELAGSHSGIPGQLVVAVKPELALLVQAIRLRLLTTLCRLVGVREIAITAFICIKDALAKGFLGHFHSPVSGGASLRYTTDRNIVPVCQQENAGSANLFHTLAYREEAR